jgi:hypothetical protein
LQWIVGILQAWSPSPVQRRRRTWGRAAATAGDDAPARIAATNRLDARGLQALLAAQYLGSAQVNGPTAERSGRFGGEAARSTISRP